MLSFRSPFLRLIALLSLVIALQSPLFGSLSYRDFGMFWGDLFERPIYSIGTEERPVLAKEMVAFLNSQFLFAQDRSCWPLSRKKDINENGDFVAYKKPGPVPTLYGVRIDASEAIMVERHNKYHYRYEVVQGYEDAIVSEVSSPAAQAVFSHWRKNPTVQELSDYLNEELLSQPNLLKSWYPEATVSLFSELDAAITEIKQGKDVSLMEMQDGEGHSFLKFVPTENPNALWQVVPFPNMEYYRPSIIALVQPITHENVDHVGTKNDYKLLNQDVPYLQTAVTVKEYVTFLNAMGNKREDSGDWYYDRCLMDPHSSEQCVIRSSLQECKNNWFLSNKIYHYTVKEGFEDQVVDAISSHWALEDYSYWRSYPTNQELADYMEALGHDVHIASDGTLTHGSSSSFFQEKAWAIKKRYEGSPNADDLFKNAQDIVNKFVLKAAKQAYNTQNENKFEKILFGFYPGIPLPIKRVMSIEMTEQGIHCSIESDQEYSRPFSIGNSPNLIRGYLAIK